MTKSKNAIQNIDKNRQKEYQCLSKELILQIIFKEPKITYELFHLYFRKKTLYINIDEEVILKKYIQTLRK